MYFEHLFFYGFVLKYDLFRFWVKFYFSICKTCAYYLGNAKSKTKTKSERNEFSYWIKIIYTAIRIDSFVLVFSHEYACNRTTNDKRKKQYIYFCVLFLRPQNWLEHWMVIACKEIKKNLCRWIEKNTASYAVRTDMLHSLCTADAKKLVAVNFIFCFVFFSFPISMCCSCLHSFNQIAIIVCQYIILIVAISLRRDSSLFFLSLSFSLSISRLFLSIFEVYHFGNEIAQSHASNRWESAH